MSTTQHPMDWLAEQPMTDEMRACFGRWGDAAVQSDPHIWAEDARPMIREAGAAYRRGGRRAARAVVDGHRRRGLHRPQTARTPRAASSRQRGSRRTTGSRSPPSGDDNPGGDDDPDDVVAASRTCGACGESCGPSERTCAACRQRRSRARRRAEQPSRPAWPERQIVAAAMAAEPLPMLAALMADPPHGALTGAAPA